MPETEVANGQWRRIASLVEAAIALEPSNRLAYLQATCGSDPDLQRQVESLLVHHEREEALRAATVGFSTRDAAAWVPWAHDRFDQVRPLGSGGFGDVYHAYDRLQRRHVAVKVLRTVDVERLDRFKKEFRQTAALTHHNVVQLYELFSDGERWFFTMELVGGVSILDHVRALDPAVVDRLPEARWERLHAAFRQLAEGVCALHAAGIVHGDLKPQNVLVTPQGRVVLLDFGLLREVSQQPSLVAGTPAYMAPEQLAQAPAAPAADWYAFGVLLYEALTGTVPFAGSCWEVLWKKLNQEAVRPGTAGVPEPLVALCEALLRREPAERPSGREVLEQLAPHVVDRSAASVPEGLPPLVGRRHHLRVLREAFDAVAHGPVAVHLQGPSGIGKTALVRQFVDTLRHDRGDVVVLAGRCYEAESIPFKALDELVDRLGRYLCELPGAELDAVLPTHLPVLQRVFPALRRVEGGPRRPGPSPAVPPQELRDRALGALRELLERLAERRPLVLWIDDLQWGDRDSVRILRELQDPATAPRLLLILSYRSEDVGVSPVLEAVTREIAAGDGTQTARQVVVGELSPEEALELVTTAAGELRERDRAAVVAEAGGNPLFLQELARQAAAHPDSVGRALDLVSMIQQRLQDLRAPSRRLLDVIAVAGRPVLREVAFHAAGLDEAEPETPLVAEFLVRAAPSLAGRVLDTYHDKVREAVLGLLSPGARRACHEDLARALEADGHADPERLVEHYRHAGIEREAYRCALAAAQAAEECLAFDRAASLVRLALDLQARLSPADAIELGVDLDPAGLWPRLARSLGDAGRSAEAADAYARAADAATGRVADGFRGKAVDHLMRSGQIDEGLRLLTTTLRQRGMRIPRSRAAQVGTIAAAHLWLRLRGLTFRERSAAEVPAPLLARVDQLWTAGAALTAIDPTLSAFLRAQHLRLALRAGEVGRVSMGLALLAVQWVQADSNAYASARQVLDRARELALRSGDPRAEAMTLTAEAGTAYFCGRMDDAFRHAVQAEEILEEDPRGGVAWELAATRMWSLSALSYAGRWNEYAARMDAVLRDARKKCDRYAQWALPLSTGHYGTHLAADRPEAARQELDEMIALWGRTTVDLPRVGHWTGVVETLLYERKYEEAWRRVVDAMPVLRRSLMVRVDLVRLLIGWRQARCALGLHAVTRDATLLDVARRFVQECAKSQSALVQGWGLVVDAASSLSQGGRDRALARFQLAEERMAESGGVQVVTAIRRRRGELLGGTEGARLVESADARFREMGVVDPARMTERLIPGAFVQT